MGVGNSWGALSSMFKKGSGVNRRSINKRNRRQADEAAMQNPICERCMTRHTGEC